MSIFIEMSHKVCEPYDSGHLAEALFILHYMLKYQSNIIHINYIITY